MITAFLMCSALTRLALSTTHLDPFAFLGSDEHGPPCPQAKRPFYASRKSGHFYCVRAEISNAIDTTDTSFLILPRFSPKLVPLSFRTCEVGSIMNNCATVMFVFIVSLFAVASLGAALPRTTRPFKNLKFRSIGRRRATRQPA